MTEAQVDDCCGIAPDSQMCAIKRPAAEFTCPGCGTRLRPVSAAHVMHQIRGPGDRGVEGNFGFCPSPGCAVVYLGDAGLRFEAGDLRHPPAYKTPDPSNLLCFCFDVTGVDALSPAGDTAVAFISDRVRAGDCACDVLNPAAGCCLGSIAAYRKARAALP